MAVRRRPSGRKKREPAPSPQQGRWRRPLEFFVVLCLLAGSYGIGIGAIKFHPDESQWIATSSALEDFAGGRFDSATWGESYWTQTQPPLVRYVIGLGRRMGGYRPDELNRAWNWTLPAKMNEHRGAVPMARLLWWSRLVMVVLAIATCGIGFHLLRKSLGRIAAYAWVVLWLISPFFHVALRRAMGEAPLLACVALVLLLCARVLSLTARKPERTSRSRYLWLAGVGVAAGLAGEAKLNGLSTLLAGVATAVWVGLVATTSSWRRRLAGAFGGAAIVMFCATVTFVGLNPYLWPSPWNRTVGMVEFRLQEIDNQKRAFPDSPIHDFKQRIEILPDRILNRNAALALDTIVPNSWPALRGLPGLAVNGLFAALGLLCLLRRAWRHVLGRAHEPVAVAIVIVGFSAAAPPLWTPLDWDRYYLLPVFSTTLLIAVGIDWAARTVAAKLSRRRGGAPRAVERP